MKEILMEDRIKETLILDFLSTFPPNIVCIQSKRDTIELKMNFHRKTATIEEISLVFCFVWDTQR